MATASLESGELRVLLAGVSWQAYEALLSSWANRPVRLTYDHGMHEIMSPLHSHEQYGALIAQLIETYTIEENIPRHTGGSTTFRREAKRRGLEPNECYWIQHELAMRGRKEFDSESDPPPDLAIEIDITTSSIDRIARRSRGMAIRRRSADDPSPAIRCLRCERAESRLAEPAAG